MAVESAHAVGSFFTQLLQAKRDGALPADGLAAVFEAGALHVLSLKQAHRELCEASEALREATSEAKTQLDQSSLQLQNLLYEQQHYEKEIAGCRAFQSAYPGGVWVVRRCASKQHGGLPAAACWEAGGARRTPLHNVFQHCRQLSRRPHSRASS